MRNLTIEQKAKIYNQMLFQYQRLQEEVRLIKAQSINLSESDEKKIIELEKRMKIMYNETQMLYR